MKSKASEQVLTALQRVVGEAVKSWLNENKADVLQALRAAIPVPGKPEKKERHDTPQFLNTAELATRWQFHPESIRRMVRQGRLPRTTITRRVLIPLSYVLEHEKANTLP